MYIYWGLHLSTKKMTNYVSLINYKSFFLGSKAKVNFSIKSVPQIKVSEWNGMEWHVIRVFLGLKVVSFRVNKEKNQNNIFFFQNTKKV